MKARVYHKDGIAFTVYNVVEIIDESKVIIMTYKTGSGEEKDYFFKKEDVEKIRIEV